MANVYDRWHKSFPKPDDVTCECGNGKRPMVPTAEHGKGDRWQARWTDGRRQLSRNFARKWDAEQHIAHLDGTWCLVPDCKNSAATEPPVLLCAEHRDMIVQQVTRKKPAVHDPLVYFIRNGDRVKIGWTTNLRQRLSALALPQDSVALTIPGASAEETALHHRFARARIGRSEWFTATQEIEAYIAAQRQRASR